MIGLSPNGVKIMVATQPVDFRRGMNGLVAWWRPRLRPIPSYASGEILWRSRHGASRGLLNLASSAT